MKVNIIGGHTDMIRMFVSKGFEVVKTIEEAELIQFTGGADVNPALYGQMEHNSTFFNKERDFVDLRAFMFGMRNKVPMAGICRGAQLLNVCNGGTMYQDVSNHTRGHNVLNLETEEEILCSSTHHQMMIPNLSEGELLGVVNPSMSNRKAVYKDQKFTLETDSQMDCEVIFYEESQSICFQPHPEYMPHSGCEKWYFDLLETKLGVS